MAHVSFLTSLDNRRDVNYLGRLLNVLVGEQGRINLVDVVNVSLESALLGLLPAADVAARDQSSEVHLGCHLSYVQECTTGEANSYQVEEAAQRRRNHKHDVEVNRAGVHAHIIVIAQPDEEDLAKDQRQHEVVSEDFKDEEATVHQNVLHEAGAQGLRHLAADLQLFSRHEHGSFLLFLHGTALNLTILLHSIKLLLSLLVNIELDLSTRLSRRRAHKATLGAARAYGKR